MPELPDVELYKQRLDREGLNRRIDCAVLKTAIATGAGSEQFLDRLPEDFLLHRREAEGRCPRCAAGLTTLKISGRTAYFCRRCQPA